MDIIPAFCQWMHASIAYITERPWGAKFSLSFYGRGITLFGNVSVGMSFELMLDDTPQNVSSSGQTLAELTNLNMGQHTIILTTKQGGSQSSLWFDKAVVDLGTATYGSSC